MDRHTSLTKLRKPLDYTIDGRPVIVHITESEFKKLSQGIPPFKGRIREGAKGLLVTASPYGGLLGFFSCVSGSKEGLACFPDIRVSGGTVTFGGCRCVGGKDPVDYPGDSETETCGLHFSSTGRLTCTGTCKGGRKCRLVSSTSAFSGRPFFTCECSSV